MTLVYCYDAYCGWCYGFSPIVKQITEKYKNVFKVEVLSGGMILPEQPTHIAPMALYIQKAYKRVEELTGIKFGEDFLWHIFNPDKSDWFPNSLKPAIALSIIKDVQPESTLNFASDLQYALNYEGRDLTDDEAYLHLLEKYQISVDDFYNKLKSDDYRKAANDDFVMTKQLGVTSFPALLLQVSDRKFYLVSKGYTDTMTIDERLQNILKEVAEQN